MDIIPPTLGNCTVKLTNGCQRPGEPHGNVVGVRAEGLPMLRELHAQHASWVLQSDVQTSSCRWKLTSQPCVTRDGHLRQAVPLREVEPS